MGESDFTLRDLASHIDARLVGDETFRVSGLGSLGTAAADEISHLSSVNFKPLLTSTRAGAVILKEADLAECPTNALVVDNPYLSFARISQLFVLIEPIPIGIHPHADVAPDVQIDPTACIGAGVHIGSGTRIGARSRVYANTFIGSRCVVGEDVAIMPCVVLYADVKLGDRSIIHSGAIIGADGFGFTPGPGGKLVTIAQLGGVTIGEEVSVGSCTAIDCGAIDDTVIEDGVKIDNQVQIGHNSHIGAHTMICGCVGIAGSSRIGRHCVLAGGSGVGGGKPVELCDHVVLSAATIVTSSITKPGIYSGVILHTEHNIWKRNAIRSQNLDALARRVNALEKQLQALVRD
ncbi:MAG: UDP-3-O-(3-hydroxymyristoyl)glucosamine N-acyltransferase [Proteobacteria bacterium]|nr:UDP-3-O-(3-hydroxymyristoyl)glucosamine N-acyltransferase [Pseudomonadota bacterium]